MKKITAIIVLSALVLSSLTGCNQDSTSAAPTVIQTEPIATTDASSQNQTEEQTTEQTETTMVPTESSVEETTEATAFGQYENLFVVTKAKNLNVREKPSTDATVLGTISEYGGGNVIGLSEDGEWLEIESGAVTGFIAKEYALTGEDAVKVAQGKAKSRIKITEQVVNIRTEAALDGAVLGSALGGSVYDYSGISNGFYIIDYTTNKKGYIHESCVQEGYYLTEAKRVDNMPTETETEETTLAKTTEKRTESPSGRPGDGIVICIDAGHQQAGISEKEPIGPGSTELKAKLTTGTTGVSTGNLEYVINLAVALKLQTILVENGYTVVMIRTTNDCPLSNAERAQVANNNGADAFIRIHCNSVSDSSVKGLVAMAPSASNPYLSASLVAESNALCQNLLDEMYSIITRNGYSTRKMSIQQTDSMTGINWSQVPVAIIEMGFMSNVDEDRNLGNAGYQNLLALGMAEGINKYFGVGN